MEPELGLGIVRKIDVHTVLIEFPASQCQRTFSKETAPLRRVIFKPGDVIVSRHGGAQLTVLASDAADGLICYRGDGWTLAEEELSDVLSFTAPLERLQKGYFDRPEDFVLRRLALMYQKHLRQSPLHGFQGGRIDLIPHQLFVAHAVCSLQIPRVLLSDETGLGKTIEACLILHRLLITERTHRVLICVPPALVHQWFVELLRRFNLSFRIYDEDYCQSLESTQPEVNPFLQEAWILCSVEFLVRNPRRQQEAAAAGWDMLVIDEAHHLGENSPGYHCAEILCEHSHGVLLITATPEQLGHRSHFARLRLLDPARYHDYAKFEQEEERYQSLVELINALLDATPASGDAAAPVKKLAAAAGVPLPQSQLQNLQSDAEARDKIIADWVDCYGTGRAIFRNTRADLSGYPERHPHLIALQGEPGAVQQTQQEFFFDTGSRATEPEYNYAADPRVHWLAGLIRKQRKEKILLICHSTARALAIADALKRTFRIETALFHESMSLLQRDRQAGWFAQPDGPRLLISSEIGSEGRNFQFCHHLVLFDLPLDPEVLEQRIGRLDRIGQTQSVHIHVPYLDGSGGEILARWYHEGLEAFAHNIPGVFKIYEALGERLQRLGAEPDAEALERLIADSQALSREIEETMRRGRDRLLAMNSYRSGVAEQLRSGILSEEESPRLQNFLLKLMTFYGIRADEIAPRTYQLSLSLLNEPEFPLPALRRDKLIVTFDRGTALRHEDIEFLTWDHPMAAGAIDLFLSSEKGNCTVAAWPQLQEGAHLMEIVYVLECVAPRRLHSDRFLPPTPLHLYFDAEGASIALEVTFAQLNKRLRPLTGRALLDEADFKTRLRERLIPASYREAERRSRQTIEKAMHIIEDQLTAEIDRLIKLQKKNGNIRAEEITRSMEEREALRAAIPAARLRLDSLRLIVADEERT